MSSRPPCTLGDRLAPLDEWLKDDCERIIVTLSRALTAVDAAAGEIERLRRIVLGSRLTDKGASIVELVKTVPQVLGLSFERLDQAAQKALTEAAMQFSLDLMLQVLVGHRCLF